MLEIQLNFIKKFQTVFTIEASEECLKIAKKHLGNRSNIAFYSGTSEDIFEPLLKKQKGSINIWLDAHYSGGITHKGSNLSSIIKELSVISNNINQFDQIAVFIDDIDGHFFDPISYQKLITMLSGLKIINWIGSLKITYL